MQLQNDRLEFDSGILSVLPVVVWGTGTDGEIFRHSARAKELREDGALLTGILHPVATGDLVGVQYQQHKAHARVTKATQEDQDHHWLLRVQLLEKSRCPWAGVGQTIASAPRYDYASSRERRRFARYSVGVPVHVHKNLDCSPTFFKTKDISESGCYIETIFPLAKEADLRLSIELGSNLISCNGVVRTCDLNVGMGIEFLGLGAEPRYLLSRYIRDHVIGESPTPTVQ